MKSLIIFIVAIVVIASIAGVFISYSNQDNQLRNAFNQKVSERTAFYDKMWKIISQKGQVAEQNKVAGLEAIRAAMAARVDSGSNLLVKFVTEANPNVDPRERQELYKDLSRTIESERNDFFEQEKTLQDIKKEHDNLRTLFPGSAVLSMLGRKELVYKPITSSRTDKVIDSGKDDDVKVFNN